MFLIFKLLFCELRWASLGFTNTAPFAVGGLRAFFVSSLKFIPKVEVVSILQIVLLDGVAVYSFCGGSSFLPLIKVPVVFVAVFGRQSDDILLQKFFWLHTVQVILCRQFLQTQIALRFFMQAAIILF